MSVYCFISDAMYMSPFANFLCYYKCLVQQTFTVFVDMNTMSDFHTSLKYKLLSSQKLAAVNFSGRFQKRRKFCSQNESLYGLHNYVARTWEQETKPLVSRLLCRWQCAEL